MPSDDDGKDAEEEEEEEEEEDESIHDGTEEQRTEELGSDSTVPKPVKPNFQLRKKMLSELEHPSPAYTS